MFNFFLVYWFVLFYSVLCVCFVLFTGWLVSLLFQLISTPSGRFNFCIVVDSILFESLFTVVHRVDELCGSRCRLHRLRELLTSAICICPIFRTFRRRQHFGHRACLNLSLSVANFVSFAICWEFLENSLPLVIFDWLIRGHSATPWLLNFSNLCGFAVSCAGWSLVRW